MKVNTPSGWRDATPKKINTPGGWKDVVSVKVSTPGGWKPVWPDAAPPEPPYLYDVQVEYLPNYEVKFTAKKGRPYDPNEDEYFMFRCVQMPRDGYVYRDFTKQWAVNGYGKLDCTLEDCFGDGNPANNAEMRTTISFQITPRA